MAVGGRSDLGVRWVRDNWLHAVTAANAELSEALRSAVFLPLGTVTEHERTGILETVGDLVAHGGTIADIAARTYRHRNTIRKRLSVFTSLTGLNLAATSDLATAAIAFAVEDSKSPGTTARAGGNGFNDR
jgi:sugar diacid utilization regulator